jgi:hypothetical protein
MQDWGAFLASVVKKASVAAAQSGAAAAVGGGPQGAAAGAAAGVVVDSVMTELLGNFVQEQTEQFARLEQLNREMNGRLLALQKGVQTLLDGPILEARLLLQQAAADHTADRRERDILGARDALFRALSLAQTDARRALIAEQLAIVCVLEGDRDRGRVWLSQAYNYAAKNVRAEFQLIHSRLLAFFVMIDQAIRPEDGRKKFEIETKDGRKKFDWSKAVDIREVVEELSFIGFPKVWS